MTQILVLREKIKTIYQKIDIYANHAIRFIVAMIVFMLINNYLGYETRVTGFAVVFALSLLCAFTPTAIMVLLAGLLTVAHIYAVSPFLALVSVIILLIIYVLFARFTPKQGYVLVAIPILYMLNIPYTIPILLGIVASPLSIVPTVCGVVVYYFFSVVKETALVTTTTYDIDEVLVLYKTVIDTLINNKYMILTLCIFAIVLLVTYLMRNLSIDHAFEIAIVAGCVVNILFFLIGNLMIDTSVSMLSTIVGTILSGIIVYIIQFFRLTLDYSRVERVQFEDDQYYYYVKAVPKVRITTPERNVKRYSNPKNSREAVQELEEFRIQDLDLTDDEFVLNPMKNFKDIEGLDKLNQSIDEALKTNDK